jgi:hypothetical protein
VIVQTDLTDSARLRPSRTTVQTRHCNDRVGTVGNDNRVKILFCNIGWMESYQGLSARDKIVGGGSYVKEEGIGHEVCNFADYRGVMYGYVQPPKSDGQPGEGQINIDRMGAKDLDSVSGILVIWTATRPEGGTVVVGWYKNATVHRFYQRFGNTPKLHQQNNLHGYRIEVAAPKVVLLPIDQRTCTIPRRVKGGMGQSNVWFAAAPESAAIVRKVLALVAGKRSRRPPTQAGKTDPNHNAKVEKAAISTVRKYYEKNLYVVESVEEDNLGWDLEATLGKVTLRVEVKGLSGSVAIAQLSPNEYVAFANESASYRLAIVNEALSSPHLTVCRYSAERRRWVVDGNDSCEIDIEIRRVPQFRPASNHAAAEPGR